MKEAILTALTLSLLSQIATCDAPLPPPAKIELTSANGQFKVISRPEQGTKCVDVRSQKTLWTIPQWFRWSFISNNGVYYVTGYDGMNLLPESYRKDLVLVTFWKNGTKLREVTAGEIVPQKKMLQRTVSHFHWGSIDGFATNGLLQITRADESVLLYDPETGTRVDR